MKLGSCGHVLLCVFRVWGYFFFSCHYNYDHFYYVRFLFLLIVIAFGRASVLDLVIDASRASTAETIVFPERTSPTVAANMRFLRGGLVTLSKEPICSVLPETAVSVVASPY